MLQPQSQRSVSAMRSWCSLPARPVAMLAALAGMAGVSLAQGPGAVALLQQPLPVTQIVGTVQQYPSVLASISRGDIVSLDLPEGLPMDLVVDLTNTMIGPVTLTAVRTSVRSPNFVAYEIGADGVQRVITEEIPEVNYRELNPMPGVPGVSASLLHNGLVAKVTLANRDALMVQPLSDFVPGAPRDLHVVYLSSDSDCPGRCGNADDPPAQFGAGFGQGFEERVGTCTAPICHADIGADLDFPFYQANGSNITQSVQRIESLLNAANNSYNSQLGIGHIFSGLIIRTGEPDPYTTSNASELLGQFSSWWSANATNIPRDVAHLFTGTDLDDPVLGIANVGGICPSGGTSSGYGLSNSTFSTNFSCVSAVFTHELGHNWNAHHCPCPNNTMNASLVCTGNMLDPGGQTAGSILPYRNSRDCLSPTSAIPVNDQCNQAQMVTRSDPVTISNFNSQNNGTSACGPTSRRDVWYRFTTPADGPISITFSNMTFAAVVGVWNSCPVAGGGSEIVCGTTATTTFQGVAGTEYWIRVAGTDNSQTGTGTMVITTPQPATFCGGVQDIPPVPFTFLRSSFFNSFSASNPLCMPDSGPNGDRIYRFVAPCNGTLMVSTCGSRNNNGGNAGANTVLMLADTCFGGGQRACNDAFQCTNDPPFDSQLSTSMVAGQEIFIHATFAGGDYGNGSYGISFNFDNACDPNNNCANASRISTPFSPLAVNIGNGAGLDGQSCESPGVNWKDRWYRFTAASTGAAFFSTCGSLGNSALSIHSGCPGTPANTVVCSDNAPICGSNPLGASLSLFATQGQDYLLRVAGPRDANVTFNVSYSLPPSPTADTGCAATTILPGQTLTGSFFGLTPSTTNIPACIVGNTNQVPDGWYFFRAPCAGTVTLSTCGSRTWNGVPNTGADTALSLHLLCDAPQLAQVGCNDSAPNACPGQSTADAAVSYPLAANQGIYIRVMPTTPFPESVANTMFKLSATFQPIPGQSCTTLCDSIDFNNDGIQQDPTDLEAFFSVYSGGPCIPSSATCNDLDFNNDGIEQDPTDLEAFFSVYSGGPCR